jgi:small nuclear ribonucleoprotein (snRNP)-like protein
MSLTRRQGFDEFMNLVIDDAVEVTLANAKKETPEARRNIGQPGNCSLISLADVL